VPSPKVVLSASDENPKDGSGLAVRVLGVGVYLNDGCRRRTDGSVTVLIRVYEILIQNSRRSEWCSYPHHAFSPTSCHAPWLPYGSSRRIETDILFPPGYWLSLSLSHERRFIHPPVSTVLFPTPALLQPRFRLHLKVEGGIDRLWDAESTARWGSLGSSLRFTVPSSLRILSLG